MSFKKISVYVLLSALCAFLFPASNAQSEDLAQPRIYYVYPAKDSVDVSSKTSVIATFTLPKNVDLKSYTISLNDGDSGAAVGGIVDYGTYKIKIGDSYVILNVIKFTPDNVLDDSTKYAVNLAQKDGQQTYESWSFVTSDAPVDAPPEVINTEPAASATDTMENDYIQVVFSESIDPLSINEHSIVLKDKNGIISGMTQVVGNPMGMASNKIVFIPSNKLSYSTKYSAVVDRAVKDFSNNEMTSDYTWNFETVDEKLITKLEIANTTPMNDQVNVSPETKIFVYFSKGIELSTFDLVLKDNENHLIEGKTEKLLDHIISFTPNEKLENAKTYTVTIPHGVKGLSKGEIIQNDYSWSFKTPLIAVSNVTWFKKILNKFAIKPKQSVLRIETSKIIDETPVDYLTRSRIAAGRFHTCAITKEGGVKCWGDNEFGELGTGNDIFSSTPVDVKNLSKEVIALSAGTQNNCAILESGHVKCWGYFNLSSCDYSPVFAESYTHRTPITIEELVDVTQIAVGNTFACALTKTGHVKCWGGNHYGELGDKDIESSMTPVDINIIGVTEISAGRTHACAKTFTGYTKCWGQDINGQLWDGEFDKGIVSIDSGEYYSCIMTKYGGVQCWGCNMTSQLGNHAENQTSSIPFDVTGLASGVASISAGGDHSCAVMLDGGIKCWGNNDNGQLGNGKSANDPDVFLVSTTPTDVVGLGADQALAVSAGADHTCALMKSGKIKCWGNSGKGQLGVGGGTTPYYQTYGVPVPLDVLGF